MMTYRERPSIPLHVNTQPNPMESILPQRNCPRCSTVKSQPIEISYNYGIGEGPGFDRPLLSVTYSLRCSDCGYEYMVQKPADV